MIKYRIAVLVAAMLLAGCAANGPTNSPEFAALAQAPVPAADGSVKFSGSAMWMPNLRGFTDLRSPMLGGGGQAMPGVLVIAEGAILFEQWDEKLKAYEIVKRFALDEVMSASADAFGRGRRLVVRKKDLSFDSFSFTTPSGQLLDGDKTEAAAAFLQMRLQQRDGWQSGGTAP